MTNCYGKWQIIRYGDRLWQIVKNSEKIRLYGMSCILVFIWFHEEFLYEGFIKITLKYFHTSLPPRFLGLEQLYCNIYIIQSSCLFIGKSFLIILYLRCVGVGQEVHQVTHFSAWSSTQIVNQIQINQVAVDKIITLKVKENLKFWHFHGVMGILQWGSSICT